VETYGGICPICQREYINCTCSDECKQSIDPEVSEFLENFSETNKDALYPTGFENAIIGSVERYGMNPLILLDRDKCIEILIERDGMDHDEAKEFFEFNIIGAWMGEGTPCFAILVKKS
jgi:hypothetical protein